MQNTTVKSKIQQLSGEERGNDGGDGEEGGRQPLWSAASSERHFSTPKRCKRGAPPTPPPPSIPPHVMHRVRNVSIQYFLPSRLLAGK